MADTGLPVTPGYIFQPNEPIDNDKLDQLGNPTVVIPSESIGIDALNANDVRSIISNSPSNLSGRKNYFLNANFDHWQRGNSFNFVVAGADSKPTADCWRVTRNNDNRTVARYPFGLGQTSVPTSPTYAMKWTQEGPLDPETGYLAQRVEDVRTLAGVDATLSAWVFCNVAANIGLQVWQHFGSGGSPSSNVVLPIVNKAVPANIWTRISQTFAVPSIAGKSIGTDVTMGDWLEGRFFVPEGTAFELYFASAQLEAGDAVTAFEQYNVGAELAAVQRYYERVNSMLASAFTEYHPVIFYKVTKRYAGAPVVIDIEDDAAEPYDVYYTALDRGSAKQILDHAQAGVTVEIAAELEL